MRIRYRMRESGRNDVDFEEGQNGKEKTVMREREGERGCKLRELI